jgi:hypothetical protein
MLEFLIPLAVFLVAAAIIISIKQQKAARQVLDEVKIEAKAEISPAVEPPAPEVVVVYAEPVVEAPAPEAAPAAKKAKAPATKKVAKKKAAGGKGSTRKAAAK